MEEDEIQLPPIYSPDHTVRVPPEMMPTTDQGLRYFDYFFANIHPYVPVLNKAYFFRAWHYDPDSISPLLLEAVLACSSAMMDDRREACRWLALASSE